VEQWGRIWLTDYARDPGTQPQRGRCTRRRSSRSPARSDGCGSKSWIGHPRGVWRTRGLATRPPWLAPCGRTLGATGLPGEPVGEPAAAAVAGAQGHRGVDRERGPRTCRRGRGCPRDVRAGGAGDDPGAGVHGRAARGAVYVAVGRPGRRGAGAARAAQSGRHRERELPKNGKQRIITVPPVALAAVSAMPRLLADDYIFHTVQGAAPVEVLALVGVAACADRVDGCGTAGLGSVRAAARGGDDAAGAGGGACRCGRSVGA
jgi:hypothetical protein